MGWLSVIAQLLHPAHGLIASFRPGPAEQARRDCAERLALSLDDLAALQQLAAALQPRAERTSWDAFIDGLSRVPRPLITLGVLAFFLLAPLDPPRFAEIARAYEQMPDGFWALLSVVVAFYFGGRMQLKRQDMALRGGALEVAREVLALQRAARAHEGAQAAGPACGDVPGERAGQHSNRVIEAWKRQRALAAPG
jgi:hypothetical protein